MVHYVKGAVFISEHLLKTFFFSIRVFFHERFTGQQGKGEVISLSPLYYFHPLHRHLEIGRVIAAESSTRHIASSHTQSGTFGFQA